jgi:hypothetical protein
MPIYRCILPDWTREQHPEASKTIEGQLTDEELKDYNELGYNIYYFPNSASAWTPGTNLKGPDIDIFNFVFVDCDLKDGVYSSTEEFIEFVANQDLPPTYIIDSGHGIHCYWQVSDLEPMSYLRLQRRLCRKYKTDEAVSKICQLMRAPGYKNTKNKENQPLCEIIYESEHVYSCEELDKKLPIITPQDELYCNQHYNKTYQLEESIKIEDKIPLKFSILIRENKEARDIWAGGMDDRSKSDYRLAHIMFANGFTREEASSVLVNSAKALQRGPSHRITYATNIVDKIWVYEEKKDVSALSLSVRDILSRGEATVKGTRFACSPLLDDTESGFRLGHVVGLVAGSGVGKTSVAINMFRWFTERNPDYIHFFVSLEQTDNEIAARWRTICQGDDRLHDKVHVLSNYAEDGSFRHLSLDDIKKYILDFQKTTGKKVGTCVIDHIGVLCRPNKNGQNQAIADVCHQMKSFAIETNTMVIMQSQAPREKAGIGDLELNKDCAYGSVFFESYVDWLLAIWQPLKRCYAEGAPTIMAFKYCKIRHKKQGKDKIQEDVCYSLFFNPETEQLRELTENEEKSMVFFQNKCVNKRKQDRKTEVIPYESRRPGNENTKVLAS